MVGKGTDKSRRQREERRKVAVPARLRIGARWTDATILNVSSKGLMVYAQASAEPGHFIELRRGEQIIVARVVWRRNRRIGLHSQDCLPVDSIISGRAIPAATAGRYDGTVERRAIKRGHDESRLRARMIDFISLVIVAVGLAGVTVGVVQKSVARPLATVEAALKAE